MSTIAAVSNRGLMRFRLYEGALNVAIFIDFLKRLVKDAKQKVFLIVDNLRVHHAKAVMEWLAQHTDEIELFYLPAYAQEHNPDEYLNNDLRQTNKNKPRAKTHDDLVATTSSILKSIQRRPHRVKSYFHAKHVRYAARCVMYNSGMLVIAPYQFDAGGLVSGRSNSNCRRVGTHRERLYVVHATMGIGHLGWIIFGGVVYDLAAALQNGHAQFALRRIRFRDVLGDKWMPFRHIRDILDERPRRRGFGGDRQGLVDPMRRWTMRFGGQPDNQSSDGENKRCSRFPQAAFRRAPQAARCHVCRRLDL